jgi:hypothetical protein
MAASRLKPRVAETKAEATDAHVGIRLNRIHTNNKARLEHAETAIDSTTIAAAAADYDNATAATVNYNYVTAASADDDYAVVNDGSSVEPEPLPLPTSARPGLRKQPQPAVHNYRWIRIVNRPKLLRIMLY